MLILLGDADNAIVPYEQYGPVLLAAAVGAALTVTEVLAVAVQLLLLVTVMVYVPPLLLAERLGLCNVELNELGPLQLYDVKPLAPPVKAMVP